MKTERIKELIQLFTESNLIEMELEEGGEKLRLRKPEPPNSPTPLPVVVPAVQNVTGAGLSVAPLTPPAEKEASANYIRAPMVGTFYIASAPDAPPYVEVGSEVAEDTVVCIIEAMKVMNEIKSEMRGVIEKILVENGQPVEYNQPLFQVRPL